MLIFNSSCLVPQAIVRVPSTNLSFSALPHQRQTFELNSVMNGGREPVTTKPIFQRNPYFVIRPPDLNKRLLFLRRLLLLFLRRFTICPCIWMPPNIANFRTRHTIGPKRGSKWMLCIWFRTLCRMICMLCWGGFRSPKPPPTTIGQTCKPP